jgi:carboxypeptidase family protein
LASFSRVLSAQSTTGSIVDIVNDPSCAVLIGAKVRITNVATGQLVNLATNSSGSFTFGVLLPGNYKTQISAKGFSSEQTAATVLSATLLR